MKRPLIALLFSLQVLGACASSEKKDEGDDFDSKDDDKKASAAADDAGARASANRVTLVNSLSNNQLTSHRVSANKAEGLIGRFDGKSKGALEGRLSAERLARKGVGQVLGSAKRLAELEMEKGAGRTIEDDVKLEIALAAITSRNFALAEYYLQALTDSKSARVKAGAYNALGVVALKDDRVPEAVLYFREALKAVGNYKPALMNLGFAALKGGDLESAKRALGDMQSDWFVQYGLITVARLEGNEGRADTLCGQVLEKEPAHKAALFNCSLLEYQNKRSYNKARALADKAAKAAGGEPGWDDKAFALANDIDFAEAEAKQAIADKKAQEKSQEKAQEKKPTPVSAPPQ